jgi:hypothetical protein
MKNIQSVIINHKEIFLLLPCLSFECYFICSNIIFPVLCLLISAILSIYLLEKRDRTEEDIKKKISAYSFFDSFLKGIEDNLPIRSSYDSSSRYLISYQKAISYDEIKEGTSLNLYAFQPYFDYIVKKDKENEALLLNYSKLRKMLYDKCLSLEKVMKDVKQDDMISGIVSVLLLFIIIIMMSIFRFSYEKTELIYSILSFLLISMFMPSVLYFSYQKERKQNDQESI